MSDFEKITKALYQRTGKYTGTYKELEEYKKQKLKENAEFNFSSDPKYNYLVDKLRQAKTAIRDFSQSAKEKYPDIDMLPEKVNEIQEKVLTCVLIDQQKGYFSKEAKLDDFDFSSLVQMTEVYQPEYDKNGNLLTDELETADGVQQFPRYTKVTIPVWNAQTIEDVGKKLTSLINHAVSQVYSEIEQVKENVENLQVQENLPVQQEFNKEDLIPFIVDTVKQNIPNSKDLFDPETFFLSTNGQNLWTKSNNLNRFNEKYRQWEDEFINNHITYNNGQLVATTPFGQFLLLNNISIPEKDGSDQIKLSKKQGLEVLKQRLLHEVQTALAKRVEEDPSFLYNPNMADLYTIFDNALDVSVIKIKLDNQGIAHNQAYFMPTNKPKNPYLTQQNNQQSFFNQVQSPEFMQGLISSQYQNNSYNPSNLEQYNNQYNPQQIPQQQFNQDALPDNLPNNNNYQNVRINTPNPQQTIDNSINNLPIQNQSLLSLQNIKEAVDSSMSEM